MSVNRDTMKPINNKIHWSHSFILWCIEIFHMNIYISMQQKQNTLLNEKVCELSQQVPVSAVLVCVFIDHLVCR
jgi:hypothetical protein